MSARQRFMTLDNNRTSFIRKLEVLAELTDPVVLRDEDKEEFTTLLANGASSLGSMAVNNLANKLALVMFRPSSPFLRLEIDDAARQQLAAAGIEDGTITTALAKGEQRAMRILDESDSRPILIELLRHAIVLGNVVMDLSGDRVNLVGIRDYVVVRSNSSKVIELILRERTTVGELTPAAMAHCLSVMPTLKESDTVSVYRWCKFTGGKYACTMFVDDIELPANFQSSWKPANFPYHVITWRLPYKHHYGVGHVELVCRDLAAHDELAESLVDGAALASVFKWIVNPQGLTDPTAFMNVANGGAIPGAPNDIELKFANVGQQLATISGVNADYVKRISQAFLMTMMLNRDAERVTATELRQLAQEVDIALGGAYSSSAHQIQRPLAQWMLKTAKVTIEGTQVRPIIITGLDALSRGADLSNLLSFLSNASAVDNLNATTKAQLHINNVLADLAAGNNVDKARYVLPQAQAEANLAQLQQQQVMEKAAPAVASATMKENV